MTSDINLIIHAGLNVLVLAVVFSDEEHGEIINYTTLLHTYIFFQRKNLSLVGIKFWYIHKFHVYIYVCMPRLRGTMLLAALMYDVCIQMYDDETVLTNKFTAVTKGNYFDSNMYYSVHNVNILNCCSIQVKSEFVGLSKTKKILQSVGRNIRWQNKRTYSFV